MNSPSSQVSLKSTSSMSLHDRFTIMLQNKQPYPSDIRDTVPQLHTASVKNQRLAQQMANRPSVQAALQNKSSLKQRLGKGSVKARLGRPMMRGGLRGMARYCGGPRGRGVLLRGALAQRLARGGLVQPQHGPHISRGGVMQRRGVRGALRGKGRGVDFVGRGWAGGRGREKACPLPTREELDAQLDDYMSMTKSHLDAQLDAYMAEVDSEDLLK